MEEVYIEKILFNDSQEFTFLPNDIIVFTGANNAGKSQILRDIKLLAEKDKASTIIIKDITLKKNIDINEIKKECQFRDGSYYYANNYIGPEYSLQNFLNSEDLGSLFSRFLNHLTTEERLQTSIPPSSFNQIEEFPYHPIQILYANDDLEHSLSIFFHKAFGVSLIVNRGAGSIIPLHVGDAPVLSDGEDRVSRSYLERLKKLPQLHKQGDGMRSFAGILLNVFTSRHTITLIDEPEAFLHPPQARLLGKMLALNKPNERQLYISTHSEDFLKGLLDANSQNIKIFRINRVKDINKMNLLNNDNIRKIWKDPILRYSNILSGLFHSKIIICESDVDCRFYQAIMSSLYKNEEDVNPDVLFTHCGGKKRLKTVISAMKALNVKIVTIADIDVLNEKTVFKDITDVLGINWTAIEKDWRVIYDYVASQRAQLNTEEIKKEIIEILESVNDTNFPKIQGDKIKDALKASTAWSKVKEVGKAFMKGDSYNSFKKIEELGREYGLFIVPVGELEGFYKPISAHGTKWVNNVLETLNDLDSNSELAEARAFVKAIIEY